MRIHRSSFLLEVVIVFDNEQKQTLQHQGYMPKKVMLPIKVTESNCATLYSVKLNNIYINKNKFQKLFKFQPYGKGPIETIRYEKNGDIIFDLFAVDPILYLLTIENILYETMHTDQ